MAGRERGEKRQHMMEKAPVPLVQVGKEDGDVDLREREGKMTSLLS